MAFDAAEGAAVGLGTIDLIEPTSASVAKGFACGVGSVGGFPFVLTFDSHAVQSGSGNVTLTCRGQLPPGTEPASAVVQRSEDFPFVLCGAFFTIATTWQQEITPSGEVNLKCQAL